MNESSLIMTHGSDFPGVGIADLATATRPSPEQLASGRKRKKVPQQLIDQALRNNPFESIPRWEFTGELKESSYLRDQLPKVTDRLLRTQFAKLAEIGLTFSSSKEEIRSALKQESDAKPYLGPYLRSLSEPFAVFQELFSFVDFIIERDAFSEKHLTAVYTILSAFAALMPDLTRVMKLLGPIRLQIAFNRDWRVFEIPTVLPVDNLAEILLAMPVCFIGGAVSCLKADDPSPSEKAKMICDAVGSKSFAWFYQMYNRRDRSIEGDFVDMPDPMPADYSVFREQLKSLVDVEVIATPYHSLASKEWSDPRWLAGLDPIAFALHEGIPFVTIFKRWSGSGIFPLLGDLMGDTIAHLKSHIGSLSNFWKLTYWHKGERGSMNGTTLLGGVSLPGFRKNLALPSFAKNLLKAFDRGTVFEFLRA